MNHFSGLFKYPEHRDMGVTLKLVRLFPILVKHEDNVDLYKLVTKDEILVIIQSFKTYKSPDLIG